MEHPYAFDVYDICGTSYGPFPLDTPELMLRAGKTRWWSSFGSRCYTIRGRPQHPLGFTSTEQILACFSRWPTSALA
jgi:hypothetical protein